MKSTIMLIGVSALLASAKPIARRDVQVEWVEEVVTVTVTAGDEPTGGVFFEDPKPTTHKEHNQRPKPSVVVTTFEQPAQPEPTTEVVQPEPTTDETQPKAPTTSLKAPTPSPKAPTGDIPLTDYKQAMLDHHNIHRANHSASALTWDDRLANIAETIGKGCVFAHDMKQDGGGYGQNLASFGATGDISDLQIKYGAGGVTNQWYNGELMDWLAAGSPSNPSDALKEETGHFTQVVWDTTTKVGCATVQCPAGTVLKDLPSWYTVCNYSPPGNYEGQYSQNVKDPLGNPTTTV